MEQKDIEHLGTLARIELTESEKKTLAGDITEILEYVSAVNEITTTEKAKKAEGLMNVMRDDEPSHEPGEYTDALLDAAPKRQGQYIQVKKILERE